MDRKNPNCSPELVQRFYRKLCWSLFTLLDPLASSPVAEGYCLQSLPQTHAQLDYRSPELQFTWALEGELRVSAAPRTLLSTEFPFPCITCMELPHDVKEFFICKKKSYAISLNLFSVCTHEFSKRAGEHSLRKCRVQCSNALIFWPSALEMSNRNVYLSIRSRRSWCP